MRRAYVLSVDLGVARGWDVRELENGDWAWNAWGRSRSGSGVEATEAAAERAAQQELEEIAAEERAAAQQERELPREADRRTYWGPQSRRIQETCALSLALASG
jgi:hypothetical protein